MEGWELSVGAGLLRVIDLGSFSDPALRSADGSQDVLSWDPSARFGSPSATGRGRGAIHAARTVQQATWTVEEFPTEIARSLFAIPLHSLCNLVATSMGLS